MVAVTLLTVIVFSLYAMFNQTQKAFRASVTQVDVMESGRAATELITRELEQMTASHLPNVTNLYAVPNGPNPRRGTNFQQLADGTIRTNVTDEIYFLSRFQGDWHGTAYFVQVGRNNPNDANLFGAGVGTLYRYKTTNAPILTTNNNFLTNFNQTRLPPAPNTNWQRVADGVIHFQVRPFDAAGQEITDRTAIRTFFNNPARFGPAFVGDRLPAYLELELAFLEPAAVEQARGFPTRPAMINFLNDQAGKVHLFRQRIPVRTAPQ